MYFLQQKEEDYNQLTRIPFVLPLRYTGDFLVNKGIAEDTDEFSQYGIAYKRFQCLYAEKCE